MRRTYRVELWCTSGRVHVIIPKLILEDGPAEGGKWDWDELAAEYGAMLMEGLSVMGTPGKHVNVLRQLMGFLKNHLSGEDKQELLGLIEDYRQGLLPDRIADAVEAPPQASPAAGLGTPAAPPRSVPHGAHAAQSRVGTACHLLA